jgi:transcriptional regulator with XRE-family HTH domain
MKKFSELSQEWLRDPRVKAGYDDAEKHLVFGEFLRNVRQHRNLSQLELAAHTGISQADISRLEAGRWERGPTFDTVLRLVRALQLDLEMTPRPSTAGSKSKAVKDREPALAFKL